ncbi:UNVERIFIED_CONTAM: hypothetical protein BEN50_00555 [Euhalothece sp. KZN 001]
MKKRSRELKIEQSDVAKPPLSEHRAFPSHPKHRSRLPSHLKQRSRLPSHPTPLLFPPFLRGVRGDITDRAFPLIPNPDRFTGHLGNNNSGMSVKTKEGCNV